MAQWTFNTQNVAFLCWQRRYEHTTILATAYRTLHAVMNFIPVLAIRYQIANSCTRLRGIFEGLSQNGLWADFSKNLRASLFNKGLSNEPNFGRIHLAGQYL